MVGRVGWPRGILVATIPKSRPLPKSAIQLRTPLLCEILEGRWVPSAPAYLDLGFLKATGVTEVANGQRYVVGESVADGQGNTQSRFVTVAANTQSSTAQNLGGLSGTATAKRISTDGKWVAGSATAINGSVQGAVWQTQSLGQIQFIGSFGSGSAGSSALDVSNSGTVVGTSNPGSVPIKWSATTGLSAMLVPTGATGTVNASSADDRMQIGVLTNPNATSHAALWDRHGLTILTDNNAISSAAFDISPNGLFVVGSKMAQTANSPAIVETAVFWDAGHQFHTILTASGQPLAGRAIAVSNNGYMVGYTADGSGFIYRIGWQSAQSLNSWLGSHYSLNLPEATTSVNEVYFDGVDMNFVASAGMRSYFITVPEPQPSNDGGFPTHLGTPGNDIIVVDVDDGHNGGFSVESDGGHDQVIIVGTAEDPTTIFVDTGSGNDSVTVDAGGPVDISIDFGPGHDHLHNQTHDPRVHIEIVGGNDDGDGGHDGLDLSGGDNGFISDADGGIDLGNSGVDLGNSNDDSGFDGGVTFTGGGPVANDLLDASDDSGGVTLGHRGHLQLANPSELDGFFANQQF